MRLFKPTPWRGSVVNHSPSLTPVAGSPPWPTRFEPAAVKPYSGAKASQLTQRRRRSRWRQRNREGIPHTIPAPTATLALIPSHESHVPRVTPPPAHSTTTPPTTTTTTTRRRQQTTTSPSSSETPRKEPRLPTKQRRRTRTLTCRTTWRMLSASPTPGAAWTMMMMTMSTGLVCVAGRARRTYRTSTASSSAWRRGLAAKAVRWWSWCPILSWCPIRNWSPILRWFPILR